MEKSKQITALNVIVSLAIKQVAATSDANTMNSVIMDIYAVQNEIVKSIGEDKNNE